MREVPELFFALRPIFDAWKWVGSITSHRSEQEASAPPANVETFVDWIRVRSGNQAQEEGHTDA